MPFNVPARCVLYMSQGLSVKMYGFNSKVICKIMSNVSQMKGWVNYNEGGANHNDIDRLSTPRRGVPRGGGLIKTFHRLHLDSMNVLPQCSGFRRFTSCATPADLLH